MSNVATYFPYLLAGGFLVTVLFLVALASWTLAVRRNALLADALGRLEWECVRRRRVECQREGLFAACRDVLAVSDLEGDTESLAMIARLDGDHGLRRTLDLEIPGGVGPENAADGEERARGQSQPHLPAARGADALPRPAPALPGEGEGVARLAAQRFGRHLREVIDEKHHASVST